MMLLNFFLNSEFNKIITNQTQFDALTIETNDNIKLNGTFYGSINLDQNNVSITGGTIKGSQQVTGWSDEGGGIYSKVMTEPKWIYIDGQEAKLAETSDGAITSLPADNQVQATGVPGDVVGSTFVISHVRNWINSTQFKVTAESSGLITLDKDHTDEGYSFAAGNVIKFYNKLSYITDDYDWTYESGTLYIKLPSDPTNFVINAVDQDTGFNITGNNCTTNNVNIKEYFLSGIQIQSESTSTLIDTCIIKDIRQDGILSYGRSINATINTNIIYNCGTSGVFMHNSSGHSIQNNTIYNIGNQSTIGWQKDNDTNRPAITGIGIQFGSYNALEPTIEASGFVIQENIIYSNAYCGIHSSMGSNGIITKNIIYDCTKLLTDGGGIYSFYFRDGFPEVADNLEISYNHVYDIGPDGGCIYMDNRSVGNEIHHNTVYDSTCRGIFLNSDTEAHNVHDNISVRCDTALTYLNQNPLDKKFVNDKNLNNNNILVSGLAAFASIRTAQSVDLYGNGGSADNNYYINPYSVNIANIDGAGKTFAELKTAYSQDVNSVEQSDYISAPGTPSTDILLITNPNDTVLNDTAPEGYKDVDGNVVTNYAVDPWESLVLLDNLP